MYPKKYIKDIDDVTTEYIANLKAHILANQKTYFLPENMATSWCDFECWPDKTVDREHLIMPDEIMLIDRAPKGVHTYCICGINKSRKIKFEVPVIEVGEIDRNNWRNGYFLLPNFNIK